ncbi:unnamed protein product [Penicillium salamii]|nr:unnamed protein product [Penicillium salamii]
MSTPTNLLSLTAGALLLGVFLVTVMLIRAVLPSRRMVSISKESAQIIGRPLFFPVNIAHNRRSPVRDGFHNQVLLVGVPIGTSGHLGNLLSITDRFKSSASWKCWFHFDAARFLYRGDENSTLREKLDTFLRSQDLDPEHWPYAYLISVPRWFRWSHTVMSWWYLYSPEQELDAMIMEVNNFFGERRNVFFQFHKDEAPDSLNDVGDAKDTALDSTRVVKPRPLTTGPRYYKGAWTKFIYTTPFEGVDGSMKVRCCDPLSEESWASDVSFLNLTSLGSDGKTKLPVRLNCCEPPLDPARASALELLYFLIRWTSSVTLASPQILYQALRIKYKGLLKMTERPTIQRGSIPQRSSPTERYVTASFDMFKSENAVEQINRSLEVFFRKFLAHLVENFDDPVEVIYTPSRSWSDKSVCMRSNACRDASPTIIARIEIEPMEASFFGRVAHYPTFSQALNKETTMGGNEYDTRARNLWLSDLTRMEKLGHFEDNASNPMPEDIWWQALCWLRGSKKPTELDTFVLSTMAPSLQSLYAANLAKDLFSKRYLPDWIRVLQLASGLSLLLLGWLLYQTGVSFMEGFTWWKVILFGSCVKFTSHIVSQVVTKF